MQICSFGEREKMQAFNRTCESADATESSESRIRACDEITQAVTFCVRDLLRDDISWSLIYLFCHMCSDTHDSKLERKKKSRT